MFLNNNYILHLVIDTDYFSIVWWYIVYVFHLVIGMVDKFHMCQKLKLFNAQGM